MSGPAEMVRVREALDRAEAETPWLESGTAAQHQRRHAARSRANAVELARAGFLRLSAVYLGCADRHDGQARKLESEEARP